MSERSYTVVEFLGRTYECLDRTLLKDGKFSGGSYHVSAVARFTTEREALEAGRAAPNVRPGGLISAFCWEPRNTALEAA